MVSRKSTDPPAPISWARLRLEAGLDALSDADASAAEDALQALFTELDAPLRDDVLAWAASGGDARAGPAPLTAELLRAMLLLLLRRVLQRAPFNATPAQLQALAPALQRQEPKDLHALLGPALRLAIRKARDSDTPLLMQWQTQFLKEIPMAFKFTIDTSSIPILQAPGAADKLVAKVKQELEKRFGVPVDKSDPASVPGAAALLGTVVLDGEVDPASSGLPDALRRAWLESIADVPNLASAAHPGPSVPAATVVTYVAGVLQTLMGNPAEIAVQALAFVSRQVIAGASSIQFGHPNFDSAIRIALDQYVQSRATGDSLSLPPGSLPGGTQNAGGDADLNADTIRVTGLSYALALQEKTLVFKATDRVTELFMNGLLPFGHDAAGKALDDYYWDTEDRLTESQRRSYFSRLLGMPGGEVSKEVAPNKSFEQLFLRFISSVSEFTRQRELNRMFTNRTAQMSMTDEQVRKTAFEVAKNASLYGWGGGFFLATRVNRHLQKAIEILNQPQVLKAYAATNHWQVIERVAQQDFGGAPNWAKYSTMAAAANALFTILAANTAVLAAGSSGRPFLFDATLANNNQFNNARSDLDEATTNQLMLAVQQWLAVNGVSEEQVQQYAKPVELNAMPSLPGGSAQRNDSGGAGSAQVMDRIKQMVAGGSVNQDQLKQLLAELN